VDRRVHRRSDRRPEPGRAGRPDRTTAFPTKCTAGPVPDRPPSPDSHPDTASARRAPAADPHTTIGCPRAVHQPSPADPVAHSNGPARADRVPASYRHPDIHRVAGPQHHPGCDPVAAAITDHPRHHPTIRGPNVDRHSDPDRNTDVDPNVHPDGDGNSDDLPGGHPYPDVHADADVHADFRSHVVIDAISNAFPVLHPQPVTAAPT